MGKVYDIAQFGEIIEELRNEKGLTPEQLSKEMEKYDTSMAPDVIKKYENGNITTEIGIKKLIAFSNIFDVPIDDLLPNGVTKSKNNKIKQKSTDNNVQQERDFTNLIQRETGLKSKTVEKIISYNKLKNKKTCFSGLVKTNNDINEIDIIDSLIGNKAFISTFKNEVEKSVDSLIKLNTAQELLKKDNVTNKKDKKITENGINKQKKETIDSGIKEINKIIEDIYKQYMRSKLNVLFPNQTK